MNNRQNDKRIRGVAINIDGSEVKEFFDDRINKMLPYLVNYTNYQDSHPELAVERDIHEREVLSSILNINKISSVIDIGCGVGRWGKFFLEHNTNVKYVGIDYSEEILKLAKKNLAGLNYEIYCSSFQNMINIENIQGCKFDLVIINGVLMYINDSEIDICIQNARDYWGKYFFIKESVGCNTRVTLKGIYSEELEAKYSAIYRTVDEYELLFSSALKAGRLLKNDTMWKDDLHNRKETTAYYWIYERNCI